MSTKRPKTVKENVPTDADDFKPIKGINTMIENRLHAAGIVTYEQLAALSPDEIARRVGKMTGVTVERIREQNWTGQAYELTQQKDSAELVNVGFVLDLFLDAGKHVKSTQVLNVKSGEGDEWPGWDDTRLLNFFIEQSQLQRPAQVPASLQPTVSAPLSKTDAVATTAPPVIAETAPAHLAAATPKPSSTKAAPAQPVMIASEQTAQATEPILRELQVISPETMTPTTLIKSGAPFQVWLELNLSDQLKQKTAPLNYTASVYAKRWEDQSQFVVGEARGKFQSTDQKINVAGQELSLLPGVYNLTASLIVMEAEQSGKLHPVAHSSLANRVVHVN
ncbi:MAG TPA: hypothetical protein VFZ34_24155 [Blastocatellia bacterium]|nr:hypothetical protein [Blastocatellia bacterium]